MCRICYCIGRKIYDRLCLWMGIFYVETSAYCNILNVLSWDIIPLEQHWTKDLQGSPNDDQPCDFVGIFFVEPSWETQYQKKDTRKPLVIRPQWYVPETHLRHISICFFIQNLYCSILNVLILGHYPIRTTLNQRLAGDVELPIFSCSSTRGMVAMNCLFFLTGFPKRDLNGNRGL